LGCTLSRRGKVVNHENGDVGPVDGFGDYKEGKGEKTVQPTICIDTIK
jgi:hypothetical protein